MMNTNGVALIFDTNESVKRINKRMIADTGISIIFYLGIIISFCNMFNLKCNVFASIISGIITAILINLFMWNSIKFKKGKSVRKNTIKNRILIDLIISIAGVVVIFLMLKITVFQQGMLITANDVIKVIASNKNIFIEEFKVLASENDYSFYCTCFIALISILIAFIASTVTKGKNLYAMLVIMLPIIYVWFYYRTSPGLIGGCMFIIAVMLISMNSFINAEKNDKRIGNGIKSIIYSAGGTIAIVSIITLGIIASMVFTEQNFHNSFIISLKSAMNDMIYDMRYEKDKTNSFTQGNFNKLGDLELVDETALEVTMDKPESLYLRGFVGSVYTKDSWEDIDNGDYYDSYPLYYWLHKDKFNGMNQLTNVQSLIGAEQDVINISINNINANSRYLYTPYELMSEPAGFDNTVSNGDNMILSEAFTGCRQYSYASDSNLVKRFPDLINGIAKLQNDKDKSIKQYIKDESNYNVDIYKKYTQIPDDIYAMLLGHLGEYEAKEDEHIPYETAIKSVTNYLKENIEYSPKADIKPAGKDFLQYFMEDSMSGYSVHYATAATMMFRYYGIPARYVEGYLITPEDVAGLGADSTIEISGQNAHAWVEIYFDTVGWVPIEVTPAYIGLMEAPDVLSGVNFQGGNSNGDEEDDDTYDDEEDEELEEDKIDKETKEDAISILKAAIIVILALLILFTLGFVIRLFVKHYSITKKRKNNMNSVNNNEAICAAFNYLVELLEYGGFERKQGETLIKYVPMFKEKYSEKYSEKYKLVLNLSQEAAFSEHELDVDDRKLVKQFTDVMMHEVINSRNVFKRLKMRIIDCMY